MTSIKIEQDALVFRRLKRHNAHDPRHDCHHHASQRRLGREPNLERKLSAVDIDAGNVHGGQQIPHRVLAEHLHSPTNQC